MRGINYIILEKDGTTEKHIKAAARTLYDIKFLFRSVFGDDKRFEILRVEPIKKRKKKTK